MNRPENHHQIHQDTRGNIADTDTSDVFDLSSFFIFLTCLFIVIAYVLLATETGKDIRAAFADFYNAPVLALAIAFFSAPIGVLIAVKSEDGRDVFLSNAVFMIFLLLLTTYDKILNAPLLIHLPGILGFGLNLRVDRLTYLIVVAASGLWLLAMIYGHRYMKDEEHNRSRFFFWMTITLGGVLGGVMANDLLSMFLFFEIIYLCCYFLVSHNQSEEALSAGNRYIYTGVVGGLTMLLGISLIFVRTNTFMIPGMSVVLEAAWSEHSTSLMFAIGCILFGFAIKAAVFPMHFWLPDAHSCAPSPASAVLSGMVIKVYIFSVMKFLFNAVGRNLMTVTGLTGFLIPLSLAGMIMGSVFAIGQKDLKKMLAYSSVAQIGYMLLGIGLATELGFAASVFHITTHALTKSALFLSAGAIMYQTGKRKMKDFQGLGYEMPFTMGVFAVGALSMIGIPGFNGFMSKWYLSLAALEAGKPLSVLMILLSSFLNAMYYLPIVISAFLRESEERENVLVLDRLPGTMLAPMLILALGCIVLGFFPQFVMGFIQDAVSGFSM